MNGPPASGAPTTLLGKGLQVLSAIQSNRIGVGQAIREFSPIYLSELGSEIWHHVPLVYGFESGYVIFKDTASGYSRDGASGAIGAGLSAWGGRLWNAVPVLPRLVLSVDSIRAAVNSGGSPGKTGDAITFGIMLSTELLTLGETGERAPEQLAIREVGTTEAGLARKDQHHVFPQEEREFFEARGFTGARSIDRYTLTLDKSTHQAIHGGGDWRLGRTWEGEWNNQIMKRILDREFDLGRQLTFGETMKVGGQMTLDYKLGGIRWEPFREKKE